MEAVIVAVATGIISTLCTVVALKTDMNWIKREIERLEGGMLRAHTRIDSLEKHR